MVASLMNASSSWVPRQYSANSAKVCDLGDVAFGSSGR
jgi:hypothetical protein